jgi:predicted N-acetyltransferase YhbS
MTISEASAPDIPALNILINSAYRGESARKGWTTEADLLDGIRTDEPALAALLHQQGASMLVCRDKSGRIIGCVYLQKEPETFYLGMLTVDPGLQAAGIGSRLLHAAEEHVKSQQGNTISMTVISVRHELIAWYERKGYSQTGETKPFPDDPAFGIPRQPLMFVVMKKKL